MARFDQFLAIDWSGATGERHAGIALAIAGSDGGVPVLVERGLKWSRAEVLGILRDLPSGTLVGMDLGISLPFADCGAFFPGLPDGPHGAKALWAQIDQICADDLHLGANSFVDDDALSAYFRRHAGREGAAFRCDGAMHGRGRFRVTELRQGEMGLKPYSNFNLVGAAQVGKSSLTGMRVLHALQGAVPVWPIDTLPSSGSVICEIYTSLAAIEAGRTASRSKIRDRTELDDALHTLGSPGLGGNGPIDDHSSDAIITAAWLRKVANDPARWTPNGLTAQIAQTEGWTFGVT